MLSVCLLLDVVEILVMMARGEMFLYGRRRPVLYLQSADVTGDISGFATCLRQGWQQRCFG